MKPRGQHVTEPIVAAVDNRVSRRGAVAEFRAGFCRAASVPAARAHGVAHLRWFILSKALRARGLGRRLLDQAMAFCRHAGYPLV